MRTTALVLAAAAVFTVVWLWLHPAMPQLPNGDIYTSLGVARHLANGDGLLNDTVYPLFTAYPWGQTMPQPLIHRPPGLAVLLLPAWWLAGGDPVAAESLVRPVMAVMLGLVALGGLVALARLGRWNIGPAWLLLLLVNPLLALAVQWGWGEVPAMALLMVLWQMVRRRRPADSTARRAAGYAILSGFLALIRGDLLWVPVLWWFAAGLTDRRRRLSVAVARTAVAGVVGVAVMLPWWLHVTGHAGSPLSNPLTEAVQLDLSSDWWDYPLLRGREPVPLGDNLAGHPVQAVHKVLVGGRSYLRTLGLWLPWYFWFLVTPIWLQRVWRGQRQGIAPTRACGPYGLLMLTLVLMIVQYALFSHETRHLLPVLPLIAWEGLLLVDGAVRAIRRPAPRGAALAVMVGVALLLSPPGLGGEAGNVETACDLAGAVAVETTRVAGLPPGPVFSDNAVVPWRTGRPCVWSPFDTAVETDIRRTIPGMAGAPWVRILPNGPLSPPLDDRP